MSDTQLALLKEQQQLKIYSFKIEFWRRVTQKVKEMQQNKNTDGCETTANRHQTSTRMHNQVKYVENTENRMTKETPQQPQRDFKWLQRYIKS